jgi:hypothetical protein
VSKARKEVELAVHLSDQPGGLSKVLSIVAAEGVNVLAYCSYCDRNDTVILLVADNPVKAKLALHAAGYNCRANSVVLVGAAERVGAAAHLGAQLARVGVEILYSYASSSGAEEFFAVFKTTDDDRAVRALSSSQLANAA